MNDLPRVATRQRGGRESNRRLKSSALTTTEPHNNILLVLRLYIRGKQYTKCVPAAVHLEVWKERNVSGPLDGAEEQPRGQLADVLDAGDGGGGGGGV